MGCFGGSRGDVPYPAQSMEKLKTNIDISVQESLLSMQHIQLQISVTIWVGVGGTLLEDKLLAGIVL